MVRRLPSPAPEVFQMNTSRVLVAMVAVSLMAYGSAIAQQAPSPSSPPSPASPSASAQAGAQAQTASGELTKVDAKENELTVKTATGEVTIKYDASTKVTGA